MTHEAGSKLHETVLDVTAQQVARVYAQALLGAAVKENQLDDVAEAIDSLVQDVLEKYPGLGHVLTSALISAEEKEAVLERVFGAKTPQIVLSFLKVLARHGRLNLLRDVRRELRALYNKHQGRIEVEVRVARPMDPATQEELRRTLVGKLGGEPILNVKVDPSLIAGVIIRVADTVYDGSVATRFRRAKSAMIQHAVDLIQTKRESLVIGH